MKCYYHHDRDAFGICSNCGKGLCLECMSEKNNKIFCKNSNCAQKTNSNLSLIQILILILVILTIFLLIMD